MQYIVPPLARKIARRGFALAATCSIALLVSACSGGGGSGSTPLPPANPGAAVAPASAAPSASPEHTASPNPSPTPTPVPSVAAPATVPPAPPSSSAPSSLVYISDSSSNQIFAYPTHAGGTLAPTKTIAGAQTQLNAPRYIAFDSAGNLYVLNEPTNAASAFLNESITVYGAHSNGNVAPIRVIAGTNTGLDGGYYVGGIAVDGNGYVYISIQNQAETCPGFTSQTFTPCTNNGDATIAIFAPNSNGNVAPTRTINSDACWMAAGLAVSATGALSASCNPPIEFMTSTQRRNESQRRHIETDPGLGQIVTFSPGASGNAVPTSTITAGGSTGIDSAVPGFALSPLGLFYVYANALYDQILGFPQDSNGTVTPTINIDDAAVTQYGASLFAVGPDGFLYASTESNPPAPCVHEFAPGANGSDPPAFELSTTGATCPYGGIAIGPP